MSYIENPKTHGSGIVCAIPQTGSCPVNCPDCFFNTGRSYLEPFAKTLPNMPPVKPGQVVRVNDGHDSYIDRAEVIRATEQYPLRFFNTSFPQDLAGYPAPVVLTLNPGKMTDILWNRIDKPSTNLMFVRFRVNTWNLVFCDEAVDWYAQREVPVVLTFMAYHKESAIRQDYRGDYVLRTRTTNPYYAITTAAWQNVMRRYSLNPWVYSCGKIEGEHGTTKCRYCGNCLREFFATLNRRSQ
jgi:hypothetical protein